MSPQAARPLRWPCLPLVVLLAWASPQARLGAAPDEVGLEAGGERVGQASQAWMDAWRAKDATALARVAARRDADPLMVLASMLSAHAGGSVKTPPEPKDFLPAARDYARAVAGRPQAPGATALLEAWLAFGPQEFARDAQLRSGLAEVRRLRQEGAAAAALAVIATLRATLDAAPMHYRTSHFDLEEVGLLREQGRFREARVAAERLRDRGAAIHWPYGEARGHLLLADEDERAGDLAACATRLEAAASIYDRVEEPRSAAIIRARVVLQLTALTRYEEALALARRLRETGLAAHRADLAASALVTEAGVALALGRHAEAVRLCQQAVAEAEQAHDLLEATRAMSQLAQVYTVSDRHGEALTAHERAVALAEQSGDPALLCSALSTLGITWRRLKRLDRALEVQRRAVEAGERARNPFALGLALGNLGIVEAELGLPTFRGTLERALALKQRSRDRLGEAETQLALGSYLARDPAGAPDGRRLTEQALALLRQLGRPDRLATGLSALADQQARAGQPEQALASGLEARALAGRVGDRSSRAASIEEGLARLHLAAGRAREALEAASRALDIRREHLLGLGEEEALGLAEAARASSDLGMEAALALSRAGADPEVARAAFDLVEQGRATLLAAGLVNAQALLAASVPAPLTEAEARARAQVGAARARLLAAASATPIVEEDLAPARQALERAATLHADAVARIEREAQRAAGVVFPRPVRASGFCATLAAGTAWVTYHATPQHLAALVATCDGVQLIDLGAPGVVLADAEAYARLVATPASEEAPRAAALYERLVRPLEPALGDRLRLIVAPDGALAFLPFEALLRRDGPRSERLLERCEVVYAPSATAFAALLAERLGATPGVGFLGLGDPTPGTGSLALPALPHAADEVRTAAALYPAGSRQVLLGKDASLARLRAALPTGKGRLAALHLACHAFVDPEIPRLSSLVLADGEVLDLDAIHRLRIPADLAVLSACATGQGKLQRGEGVLGFARGFFVAGVPRVLVSDWVVADDDAARLLTVFHERLVAAGQAPVRALREAKRRLLSAGGATAHPFSWAAFVLWGLPD